jgi:CYTH domain-containing protein
MEEIEREKTYLAKYLPDLSGCESKEMVDTYLPENALHPIVRIRKQGDSYMITKKAPVNGSASLQTDQTIPLKKEEYDALSLVSTKRIEKVRYYYPFNGRMVEIDVFQGDLAGLVLVDVEFESSDDIDAFPMPEFCLVDITDEKFIAGGMLAGKSYADIEPMLHIHGYKKI